jgi:V8-like Glu-specific endopeptidase
MSSEFTDFLNTYPSTSFTLQLSPYVSAFFADSVEGFSGSPVLNEQGEVVGIYNSFVNIEEDKDSPPLISLFIETSGMRFVENLSK